MKLKTVGITTDDGRKDYAITTETGEQFYCTRHGSSFECCGFVGTIRDIKQEILLGKLSNKPDVQKSDPWAGIADVDDYKPQSQIRLTWDSVDPCAWLILLCFDLAALTAR